VSEGAISVGPVLAAVLVALVFIAVVVGLTGQLGVSRAVATASGRAVLQLAAVSVVIAAVVRSWWATAGFIVLMLAVAAITSAARIGSRRSATTVVVPIAAGALPVGTLIVAAGAMPLVQIAVLPVAGILIGGAMTAT
jgi:putative ABC transport system permease protein